VKPSASGRRSFRPNLRGRCFLTLLLLLFIGGGLAYAQDPTAQVIMVQEAVMATDVENLTPVGAGVSFNADIGRLYCFTKIMTDHPPVSIKHLWFYGDKIVMEVSLPIKSTSWRTYSAKTILPSAVGDWKVDVTSEDGTILKTINFKIR